MPKGKENIPFHICFFMEFILLNGENTLQIRLGGGAPFYNGYLTEFTLLQGEGVQFTFLETGQSVLFLCEPAFLLSPPPFFRLFKGGGRVFLYVKPHSCYSPVQLLGHTLPALGNFCVPLQRTLPTGERVCYFAPVGREGVSDFCNAETLPQGAYAVFSKEGKLLFYGKGQGLKIEKERFTVTRVLPTHRRHQTVTVRSFSTGSVIAYRAYPTAEKDPTKLPPVLTPVLFMEEVLVRSQPEDFLCRALMPRKRDFFAFFGEVLFVLPGKGENVLLFYQNGRVEKACFSLREGFIYDVAIEEV